jgi:hypothetical protein
MVAYNKSKRWSVSSYLKRFDHIYELVLEVTADKKKRTLTLKKSVANYFDVNGVFVAERFESDVVKLHNSLSLKKTK